MDISLKLKVLVVYELINGFRGKEYYAVLWPVLNAISIP